MTNEIRFITVGDPHVKVTDIENRGNERLQKIIEFINQSNADFVVFLGDLVDSAGSDKSFQIARDIIIKTTKPYYTVAGNHDVKRSPCYESCPDGKQISCRYESFFGESERVEIFQKRDYKLQLIFPGICYIDDTHLEWHFDFNLADKDLPTIIFNHGPVQMPPPDCDCCNWGEKFFGYARDMQPEIDKFTKLIGFYAGHVHRDTEQLIDGVKYVTNNGLIIRQNSGGCDAEPSEYVGYTMVKDDGSVQYALLNYNKPFVDPFRDTYLCTFYYPWTGGNRYMSSTDTWKHWKDSGHNPPKTWASNYMPDFLDTKDPYYELYSAKDTNIICQQLKLMKSAGINVVISSWWGQGHYTDAVLDIIFNNILRSKYNSHMNVKFCIYYEKEGFKDVPIEEVISDIEYIKNKYAISPYYLKIDGRPVVFVYNTRSGLESETSEQEAERWNEVRQKTGIYTILKIFKNYQNIADLADSWHQYAPSTGFQQTGKYSAFVSPGFHKYHEEPRLAREDFCRFENDVKSLASADVPIKLIETWNEWGEGTGIEPAQKINHDDTNGFTVAEKSYGTKYIDIIRKYFSSA